MTGRILIAYVSRRGSTAGIALAIGRELEAAGHRVEVAGVERITSLEGFGAAVIGAPVYMARIEKGVAGFVSRHRDGLSRIPVAAFAVGIAPVDHRVGSVGEILAKLTAALDPVKPVAVTMFAGRLDLARMSFTERTMTGLMKVLTGDFRDWDAIREWARGLPAILGVEPPEGGAGGENPVHGGPGAGGKKTI